jgi:formylmethanofuran dehydrogenase subunit E
MNADEILRSGDFGKCRDFHGHVCPGLVLGYLAATTGLERIQAERAEDEEVVAIVENSSCFVDAVQVLTGCTFGKGNLVFRDWGKMALTLLCRKSGAGIRISLRPDAFAPSEQHFALLQKIKAGQADEAERQRFQQLHQGRARELLQAPVDELFTVTQVSDAIPDKARIERSQPCDRCGEPTMPSRLVESGGQRLCCGCAGT